MTNHPLHPHVRLLAAISAAALLACPACANDKLPREDRLLIEDILSAVEKSNLTFIRKDKTFDAKAAAFYLRFRWQTNDSKISSVQDFIDLVSVGGEKGEITYMVRFPNGTELTARHVLTETAASLREKTAGK